MLTVVHLLYVYFRMKWKLMGLIGMGHCHRNLLIAQSVAPRPNLFLVIKRCSQLLNLVDPLSLSNCYGIELYMQATAFIASVNLSG